MAGEVQFAFLNFSIARGALASGKVKALAVTGPQRLPELPDVPTVDEEGHPDLNVYSWFAAFAPAGTPEPVVRRLASALGAAIKDPKNSAQFAEQGWEAIGSSPQELGRWVHDETAVWQTFVRESGLELPG